MSLNMDSNTSDTEALQALLQSLDPDAAQNVSQEALQRLSEKLSELMGADVVQDAFAYNDQEGQVGITHNGMLLNEEGLPIIEITESEPALGNSQTQSNSNSSGASAPPITLEEPPLINVSTLSPSERDLRKRERERILDLLEAEEVLEQRQEREKEAQERREALDKKRADGKTERERLLELKETQKKMGKALLRSVVYKEDHEKKENAPPSPSSSASPFAVNATTQTSKKKSVSFASDIVTEDGSSKLLSRPPTGILDWGDVSQGRLRPTSKSPATDNYTRQSEQLMKLQVVERTPSSSNVPGPSNVFVDKKHTPASNIQILDTSGGDSDDESEIGSASSDDHRAPQDSDTEHSDAELGNSDLDDETDWDFAQHQREIALEYHQKRDKIGKDTANALISHTHEPDEDSSVLELSSSKIKPASSISQFRASRLASSYADANTNSSSPVDSSILPTIVPASAAQTLQHAVRLGKLDEQGHLVGGDAGDSGSESDGEVAREILELLQRGEVYNLGPHGEAIHAVPPNASSGSKSTSQPRSVPPFTLPTEPLPQTYKTSRFKLAKTRTDRLPSSNASVVSSGSSTPVSTVGRSSPKSTTMQPSVAERPISQLSTSKVSSAAASANLTSYNTSSTLVVESPSFPPSTTSERRPDRPPTILSSHVVESSSRKNDSPKTNDTSKRVSRLKAERM